MGPVGQPCIGGIVWEHIGVLQYRCTNFDEILIYISHYSYLHAGDIAIAFFMVGVPASFLVGCLADVMDKKFLLIYNMY